MSPQQTWSINGNALPIGTFPARRILFASAHSILDFSNGASVATLDMLQGLTTFGLECQAFCTAKLDLNEDVCFEKIVGDLHEPHQVRRSVCGASRARILYTRRHQVPITFIRLDSTRHVQQSLEEVGTILQFFQSFLEIYRPDVLLTYGGDPVTQGMITLARRRGIPVVFGLHNFQYFDARAFSQVDYCVVASEFAQRHYRHKLGLDCQVLPYSVDWDRVRVARRDPRFVTFVNPALSKGEYPFVRIAQELRRRRPDIPLLVVESRGTRHTLAAFGLMTADHPDIQIMPITTDPRRFWNLTKVLLMPSLWWETQGLVAVEAMINGIPVVASDRGALPETLGDAGAALLLPERLTPVSRILPTAEEVQPWVETIIRLWDDPAWYHEQSIEARKQSQLWHPDRLRPRYAEFFRGVRKQLGPPLVVAANKPVHAAKPAPCSTGSAPRASNSSVPSLSFVVCVSDNAILKANLLTSPCLAGLGSRHEVLAIHGAPSAAAALNLAVAKATHAWVVCVHQDVYFPKGWDLCLAQHLEEAERRFGPIGAAGVYGFGEVIAANDPSQSLGAERIGWLADRGRLLGDGTELPARVATLDELLLIVRQDTPLRFDP
jgi:glycosyltransferase involved in cell wall biosynthesis